MYKTLFCFFLRFRQRLGRAFVKPAVALNPFEDAIPVDAGNKINSVLVHAFSLGSEPAFRRIYDLYAPAIYRVSVRYLQSEPLASDLVQQIFSAFWLKRVEFSQAKEVRLFLFTMAREVAIKCLKKMAWETLAEMNENEIGKKS